MTYLVDDKDLADRAFEYVLGLLFTLSDILAFEVGRVLDDDCAGGSMDVLDSSEENRTFAVAQHANVCENLAVEFCDRRFPSS